MYQSWLHPTLYTPATTSVQRLVDLVNNAVPGLGIWRTVIDTEDSVREDDVIQAVTNIKQTLRRMDAESQICVFVRVRTPQIMANLLEEESAAKLTGFVIPKASPDTFPDYAHLVADTRFKLMPILEERRTFLRRFREDLLDMFLAEEYRNLIDCLRIGANDLLGYLGIRRDAREFTVYDTPVGDTIDDIIREFRGAGDFPVSAPVFECFGPKYDELLHREVRQHIMNGLFGQTVIHPRHLRLIRDAYKVSKEDLASARSLEAATHAVHGMDDRMDEHSTHWRWANVIIERHRLFGDDDTSRTLVDANGQLSLASNRS